MYFLLEACQHPGILRTIYFLTLLLDIVFVAIPIILILLLMLDFGKAVITTSDKEIKSTKLVTKRILYAVLIFAIPWVVNIFISIISLIGYDVDYMACINNAKTGDFAYYDELFEKENEEIKDKVDSEKEQENTNTNNNGNGNKIEKDYPSSYSGDNLASGSTYSEAARAMMNVAKNDVGKGPSKYTTSGAPWCAYFVTWNLKNTTINNVGTVYEVISKEGNIFSDALAGGTIRSFENHSNLSFYYSKHYGGDYTPKTGDLIYFWYPGRNSGQKWDRRLVTAESNADHVGLVDYVDENGNIHTVEGNCGNQVKAFSYEPNNINIMGYGSWYE